MARKRKTTVRVRSWHRGPTASNRIPRAANDNVRLPRPAHPANDNYRRMTWADVRRAGRAAARAGRAMKPAGRAFRWWWEAATWFDYAASHAEFSNDMGPRTRRNPNMMTVPMPFPDRVGGKPWRWRHGPNQFPGLAYGHGVVSTVRRGSAFIGVGSGPQTGDITGQAIGTPFPIGTPPLSALTSEYSAWIKSATLDRYAQWGAWQRPTTYAGEWRAANNPMPAAMGAAARSPFAPALDPLPAQFPSFWLPGLGPNPFDAPAISPRNNPAVDQARRLWDETYPRRRTYEVPSQGENPGQPTVPGQQPGIDPGTGGKPAPSVGWSESPQGRPRPMQNPEAHQMRSTRPSER